MAQEQLLDTECCDEPYNPKASLRKSTPRSFRFSKPENPIPAQIEDAELVKAFFSTYRDTYVPYAGTDEHTSHSLLAFLISLKELSPTQNAVVSNMTRHAFGGKVRLVRRVDPVYDIEPGDAGLGRDESMGFYEFLRRVEAYGSDRSPISLRRLAKINFDYIKASGNYYMEMVRGSVAGQPVFRVYVHRPTHCLYLATPTGADRWIGISPVWRHDYILMHPPTVLPVYPNWLEMDGVQRTIVHVKEGDEVWYGRPDSMGSMLDQYFEFQAADYKSKATANAFMGQVLIEFEDEQSMPGQDQQSQAGGFDDFANELEYNFSNKSHDPQTMMVTTRPYGSNEAFVFQFKPNTNEGWFQVTQQQAENNIIKSHGWSRRMLGMDVSAGMNTNAYLDELEVLSATVIKDVQESFGEVINNIVLREAALHFGMDDMLQYSIEFQSPFSGLLEERKQANSNAQDGDNGRGSGAPQSGV